MWSWSALLSWSTPHSCTLRYSHTITFSKILTSHFTYSVYLVSMCPSCVISVSLFLSKWSDYLRVLRLTICTTLPSLLLSLQFSIHTFITLIIHSAPNTVIYQITFPLGSQTYDFLSMDMPVSELSWYLKVTCLIYFHAYCPTSNCTAHWSYHFPPLQNLLSRLFSCYHICTVFNFLLTMPSGVTGRW